MKISMLATIAMCVAVYPFSAKGANKLDSANGQSNSAEFRGFEPVTADSKNMKRRSLREKSTLVPYARMALNSEYVGVALSNPDYFHWCTSPLEVDGKIHLFGARWPDSMASWKTKSEIAHYVSDSPEGPFEFVETILDNKMLEETGYVSPVNIRLEKVDDKFLVIYTVRPKGPNEDTPSSSHLQRVGMLISDKIDGPWRMAGKNGIVLHPSETPGTASYKSKRGTCNPAFIKVGDKYHIYFKYIDAEAPKGSYAVATSDTLEGPYTNPQRCMDNITWVEDAQGFEWNGKYYLLTDDNYGHNGGIFGAQMLWKSDDGLFFKREDAVISSGTIFDYWGRSKEKKKELMAKEPFTRHESGKFERPAFLFQNGKPTYFYAVGDVNIHGGKTSEVYILKIKDSE